MKSDGLDDQGRTAVLVVLGLLALGITFTIGLRTAIECSAEVGSVDTAGGGLALPCHYAGAAGTVAQVGIVLLLGVGFLLGAHRSNRGTAIVSGAIVIVVVLSVRGLLQVPLA